MHQRGEPYIQAQTVFALPVAVDAGLDIALVQMYDQANGSALTSPNFLSFNAQDSASLMGTHVTIVGHPKGALKKWTEGVVVDANGEWFWSTAYTLPGDSGSPVLDDQGKFVGILHRGPTSEDLFTEDGVNMYSIGTASAPIAAAINALTLPAAMISIAAPTTLDQFLANSDVYMNSRTTMVSVGGTLTDALSLLGQACDAGLARQNFESPDDMWTALSPCYAAERWIDCRANSTTGTLNVGYVCPNANDNAAWANRYQSANQVSIAMNGQPDYYSISSCVAALQSSWNLGVQAGAASLQQVLDDVKPVLDWPVVYYLTVFGISSYNGTDIKNYVVNYEQQLHYELQAVNIGYAASWLWSNNFMSKADMSALVKQLMNDPNVSVGAKLTLEEYLYDRQVL
jgi:hypothetical protein